MKERRYQKAKEDATLDFVSRQAQDAILNPNIPDHYKDQIVDAAVGTIIQIAKRRAVYTPYHRGRPPLK
jgi:hypothetical protein